MGRSDGAIGFNDFVMELRSVNGGANESLEFVGVVSLWQDGTIMYSGNVEMNEIDCTGFVFQGFVDTAPLELIDEGTGGDDNAIIDDDGMDNVNECDSDKGKFDSMMFGVLIGIGSSLGFLIVIAMISYLLCGRQKQSMGTSEYELMNQQL